MAQVTIPNAGTQATSLAGGTDWFLMHRTGNTDANRVLLRNILDPNNLGAKNTPVATDKVIVGDSADGTNLVKWTYRRDLLDPVNLSAKTIPATADMVTLGDSADTANKVKKMTVGDLVRFTTYTTAGRPSAATAGAGARYYDTTLSKPGWSDGTVWRDAAGTAI